MPISITNALELVEQGDIIAYPTEAVYGLGCNPFNENALERLLELKHREAKKGLIVLISHLSQLSELTSRTLTQEELATLANYWPGPYTFLLPKSHELSSKLTGQNNTIAVRLSAHPVANALCQQKPIISTSANLAGQPPCRNEEDIRAQFPQGIAGIVEGSLGEQTSPSTIIDLATMTIIRR